MMLLLSAIFCHPHHPNSTPRPALINPACRADQPECNMHLRLFNPDSTAAQPAHGTPLAPSSPDCRFDLTRCARPPTNAPSEEIPQKRTKTPIFQGPNVARANSRCRFAFFAPIPIRPSLYLPKPLIYRRFLGRPPISSRRRAPRGRPWAILRNVIHAAATFKVDAYCPRHPQKGGLRPSGKLD